MFIDYIILAIISAGTLIWAYRHASGRDEPPAGDGDGGLPIGGDSHPSSSPPTLSLDPEDTHEDEPSSGVRA